MSELLDGLNLGLDNSDIDSSRDSRQPKEVFRDSVNPFEFIELDSTTVAFEKMLQVIDEPLKIVLIYGVPGTGKSMFLSRLYHNLKAQKRSVVHISTPILDEERLFQTISFEIYRYLKTEDIPINFNGLYERLLKDESYPEERKPIVLLDEAQLYPDETIEQIRLLSDTQTVKFVAVIHQIDDENIFNREHFKSRIWQKIQLQNVSRNELKVYIQKKLMGASLLSLANQFTPKIVKIIHKVSGGNYRVTNKLLYTLFDNYSEDLLETLGRKPKRVSRAMIEVSAIKEGFIEVNGVDSNTLKDRISAEKLWRKLELKRLLKYSVLLLIPPVLYLSYLYSIENLIASKELSSQVNNDSNSSKKLPKLLHDREVIKPEVKREPPPKLLETKPVERKAIIENSDDDFSPLIFEDDFERKPLIEENSSIDLEELFSIEDGSVKKREMVEEEDTLSSDNPIEMIESLSLEKREESNKPTIKPEKRIQADVEKAVSPEINTTTPLESNSTAKKEIEPKLENLPLNKIVDSRYFKKRLSLQPLLNQFAEDEVSEIIKSYRDKNITLQRLQNRFYETGETDIGIKLLGVFMRKGDYNTLYSFALKINSSNRDLIQPYLYLSRVLNRLHQEKLSKQVLDGCYRCSKEEKESVKTAIIMEN